MKPLDAALWPSESAFVHELLRQLDAGGCR